MDDLASDGLRRSFLYAWIIRVEFRLLPSLPRGELSVFTSRCLLFCLADYTTAKGGRSLRLRFGPANFGKHFAPSSPSDSSLSWARCNP